MLSEIDLAWIATELACEINSIRCQERMSITTFRQAKPHCDTIPGWATMIMRYGQGGHTQLFTIGEEIVEAGPDVTADELAAEYHKKKVKSLATPFTQSQQSQAT